MLVGKRVAPVRAAFWLALALALCALLAPAPSDSAGKVNAKRGEKTHLQFVLYGDSRGGDNMHRKLIPMILEQKPEFVIQTGDLVTDGRVHKQWLAYDEITQELRQRIPIYLSRGNHDLGSPDYERRVTAPFTSGNKLYYAFDKANCHFICLDSFSRWSVGSPQYKWLQADLTAAQTKARHIFVFTHEGPYSIGIHGSNLSARHTLCPLFIRYGVRAVFTSHDHIYYRTIRNGILYVVSGGAGAPLYPCHPKNEAIEGDVWESVNHIVAFTVDGDRVSFIALRDDGSLLDRFSEKAPAP